MCKRVSVAHDKWQACDVDGDSPLASYDGVAGLFGAGTRLPHRNLGIQHALISARLAAAAEAGCDLAAVDTEPGSESQRNVERLGFRLGYTKVTMRSAEA